MKGFLISIAVVFGLAIMIGGCVMSSQNGAVSLEETVQTTQSDIDTQLTKRFNMLTELAGCVKKYDQHEYKTLVDVISARGKNMSGAEAKQCIAAFSRVEERYPELKSQTNYNKLMTEIAIIENHLAQHKKAYNASVRDYNYHCRKFPTSMFLAMTGYEKKHFSYYEADASAKDNKPLNLFD